MDNIIDIPELTRPTTFTLCCSQPATNVQIAGDFSEWHEVPLNPMKDKQNTWQIVIPLHVGKHKYKYIVDGNSMIDPTKATVQDGTNNIITVISEERKNFLTTALLNAGHDSDHYGNLTKFEQWASLGQWERFGQSHSHYDWWMFPIKEPGAHPDNAVTDGDVQALQSDAEFMKNYRRGVELVALSWGWEINNCTWVPNPAPGQRWTRWGVRLAKIGISLLLFEETEYYESMKIFAKALFEKRGNKAIEVQFGFDPNKVFLQ